jgi:hypothetical protein
MASWTRSAQLELQLASTEAWSTAQARRAVLHSVARWGRTIGVPAPWSMLEAELPPLARGRVAGNRVTEGPGPGDRILFKFRRWCASALASCMPVPVKDAKPMRIENARSESRWSWEPASASEGDLITLTQAARVRVAGAAVVNDVIGRSSCRPSSSSIQTSKGGVQVDQLGDYGTKPRGKLKFKLNLDPFGVLTDASLVPDFSKSGTGTGERPPAIPDKSGTGTGERPRPRANRGRRSPGVPAPGQIGDEGPRPSPRPRANRGRGRGRGRGPGCPRPASGCARRGTAGHHDQVAINFKLKVPGQPKGPKAERPGGRRRAMLAQAPFQVGHSGIGLGPNPTGRRTS